MKVTKYGRLFSISFVMNGVDKRWQGTRDELVELYNHIGKVLDTVGDNQNGWPIKRNSN